MTPAHAFADLEEAPFDEAPVFHVEPTDKRTESEADRVAIFRNRMRVRAPTVMIAAVPNSQTTQWQKNRARKEGAVWGFPDLICLAPTGLTAFIEFKSGKGQPAQHQIACLNRLLRMGFPVAVFRKPETAIRWLRSNGFPVSEPAGVVS